MKILITGGAGFLGRKLALKLLEMGSLSLDGGPPTPITQITTHDRTRGVGFPEDKRLVRRSGDIADPRESRLLLEEKPDLIFHMAAVVSGEAEENFDSGMGVNMLGTLFLFEAIRKAGHQPRVIFASSVAVYGALMPETILDDTAALPLSSYGTQKATGELLVNDYARRGFFDGRALRLPTIVVRGGGPNKATSTFASSIIREPLQGRPTTLPVSPDTKLWILSPRRAIASLIRAAELSPEAFGYPRIMVLPGLSVSVAEMIEALADLGGRDATDLIEHRPHALVQQVVGSWPAAFEPERALAAGFKGDQSMQEIIQAFIDDELS
ncbi:MAG: D-erythronate dehydrogenase [Chloroflexota bacterium]